MRLRKEAGKALWPVLDSKELARKAVADDEIHHALDGASLPRPYQPGNRLFPFEPFERDVLRGKRDGGLPAGFHGKDRAQIY